MPEKKEQNDVYMRVQAVYSHGHPVGLRVLYDAQIHHGQNSGEEKTSKVGKKDI